MAEVTFNKQLTALLVIDPYGELISEVGKLWNRLKAVAEANNCIPHMLVLNAARKAGLRVFYALHHRYRPGDLEKQTGLDVNMPNYAGAIVTTNEIVDAISSLQPSRLGAQTVALGHS